MRFHPYSEIFPLIEGTALDELTEDIKTNGLREKIWLCDGKILDGRNRFFACQKAKVKPAYRKYTGKDPLSFVISLNVLRRHLTESQRAMAAARISTLRDGQRKSAASIEAAQPPSQVEAADSLNVGRSSVQRARRVIEEGSKALQLAVDKGEVSVSKAATVVDLPKSEQLAAAKAKPKPVDDEPERPDVNEEEEAAAIESAEREFAASLDKILASDDKLRAAHDEIKRQAAEIATLKLSRDSFMNGKTDITRLLKKEQRKCEQLEKKLKAAENEIESLKERVAIKEEAA